MNFKTYLDDIYLVESFDLTNDYKLLTKKESDLYWVKFLGLTEKDEKTKAETLKRLHDMYNYMECFYTKQKGQEYFIYTFYKNSTLELHFYDINNVSDDVEISTLNLTASSQKVFSVIVSIMVKLAQVTEPKNVRISSPNGRLAFYETIIRKVNVKYNLQYEVDTNGNDVYLRKDNSNSKLLRNIKENI